MSENDKFNGGFGGMPINPKLCFTCAFAIGDPPFANHPRKAYCQVYRRGGPAKPQDVYHYGKPCKYYLKKQDAEE